MLPSPSPVAATKAAEDRLNALLDEAYAAHDAVDRLVQSRPQSTSSTYSGLTMSAAAPSTPFAGELPSAPPSAYATAGFARGSISGELPAPPPSATVPSGFARGGIFGAQGVAMPVAPSPREANLPAQMAALQRRVEELSGERLTSSRHPSQQQQQQQQQLVQELEPSETRLTSARITSAARASRTNARLGHDLAAARATIIELEHENTALRSVLDRHRAAMREDASIRVELEEARRARAELEQARAAETKHVDELRFQLRQAEAESERLRVLLAGTVWFDANA